MSTSLFACGTTVNSLSSASSSTSIALTPIDVVLMGGQSNMVGCSAYSILRNTIEASKFNEYTTGYSGIKIAYDCWTKNEDSSYAEQNSSKGKFVSSMLGEGNSDLTFGMEVGIGEKLSNEGYNTKVCLIKFACGASALSLDWTAPSSGSVSTMYTKFVEYVTQELNTLKTSGYEPHIKAMLWMQGEGDAFPSISGDYLNQLNYFVKDLRKEFASYSDTSDNIGFAFIDGGISDSTAWPDYKTVNTAKQQFAARNPSKNIYIDTIANGLDKTTLQEDNAHYLAPSMLTLGHLFADALLPFLSKV